MKKEVQKKIRPSSKKRVLSFILLFSFLLAMILPLSGDGVFKKKELYYYYPVDWDENVFANRVYMDLDRDLIFSANNVTQQFKYEDSEDSVSPECKFFLDYFDHVIRGKYEEILSFYVDGFFSASNKPKFTMQKLYEPNVLYLSFHDESIAGVETRVYSFKVSYKIFKNNGTFRRNIHSNTAVPQVYQLIKENNQYKIYRILDIEYE